MKRSVYYYNCNTLFLIEIQWSISQAGIWDLSLQSHWYGSRCATQQPCWHHALCAVIPGRCHAPGRPPPPPPLWHPIALDLALALFVDVGTSVMWQLVPFTWHPSDVISTRAPMGLCCSVTALCACQATRNADPFGSLLSIELCQVCIVEMPRGERRTFDSTRRFEDSGGEARGLSFVTLIHRENVPKYLSRSNNRRTTMQQAHSFRSPMHTRDINSEAKGERTVSMQDGKKNFFTSTM